MIDIAILGGTGFGAGELLRLLTYHEGARVVSVVSDSHPGEPVTNWHPHLLGFYDGLPFDAEYRTADVVFSALPSGISGKYIAEHLAHGSAKVIDLSGDLRLRDPQLRDRFYPAAPMIDGFVYGLPEIGTLPLRFIANPGCLATACILGAWPFTQAGCAGPFVFDVKTGSTGSGRPPKESTHHANRHSNAYAYKALEHQHEPEVLQALGLPDADCSFVAHSLPMARGVLATTHLSGFVGDAKRLVQDFTSEHPFLRYREISAEVLNVVGTNFCDLSVEQRGARVVITSALDNLGKGMAGQAIQNMNLMCGLPETTGLWQPALRPV